MTRKVLVLFIATLLLLARPESAQKVLYKLPGDINIALLVHHCDFGGSIAPHAQTVVNAAIWTTHRLNFLHYASPLSLGLVIFQVCTQLDRFQAMFRMLQESRDHFYLGVISDTQLTPKDYQFAAVVGLRALHTWKYLDAILAAPLRYIDHEEQPTDAAPKITILAPNQQIINDIMRMEQCIHEYHVYNAEPKWPPLANNTTGKWFIIFGNYEQLQLFASHIMNMTDSNVILVPLDGKQISDIPSNVYVLRPTDWPSFNTNEKVIRFVPTPRLFEVASPLLTYVLQVKRILNDICQSSNLKTNCIRAEFHVAPQTGLDLSYMMELLKLESLQNSFTYSIFKNAEKVFSYEMIATFDKSNYTTPKCSHPFISRNFYQVVEFKSEPWVYTILSLSAFGVFISFASGAFLIRQTYKHDSIEGNPIPTIVLNICTAMIFCAVIPFTLNTLPKHQENLCMVQMFSATLSITIILALILSRSVLLSTMSTELGFMTHISGPVQCVLFTFIVAVQIALNLQLLHGECADIRDNRPENIFAYNGLILMLELGTTPVIVKCRRNYNEGKHYTIATILMVVLWCIWVPSYVWATNVWKPLTLSCGFVTTGAIMLAAIFVPRTYHMGIARARDKYTGGVSSVTNTASAADIYRIHSCQPIYDCLNIETVNSITRSRSSTMNASSNHESHYPQAATNNCIGNDASHLGGYDNMVCCGTFGEGNDKATKF